MCPRPPLCATFAVALFLAVVCGVFAIEHASADAPPVFLPLVQPNQPPIPEPGPPASVRAGASAATVTAGQAVTLTATLFDIDGNLVAPNADLDVLLSVGGRDLLADWVATAPGPVSYSAAWTPPAAGVYTVGAVAARAADGAKAGLPAVPFTLTVAPGPVAALDVAAHAFAAIALPDYLALTLYDAAGNALPNPPPNSVTCATSNPVIQAGAAQPLPAGFYTDAYGVPLDGSRQLGIPLTATGYGTAAITCTHTSSGIADTAPVASAPWELRLSEFDMAKPANAFLSLQPFVLRLDLRVPPGAQWTDVTARLEYPSPTVFQFSGCNTLAQPDTDFCNSSSIMGPIEQLRLNLHSSAVHSGVTPALRTNWSGMVSHLLAPVTQEVKLTGLDLSSPSGAIAYDPAPFDPWRTLTVTMMSSHSLPVHVYAVAGAAEAADMDGDLARTRRALEVHRASCLPAFDLQAQVTEIPADVWAALDPDGDGFDQWDANGDGNFTGAADGNDFAAAAAAGYADPVPGTINVYYVPQVRGAPALAGSANALALDGARRDDWALFHLLVHALDLRADGDRDLAHGPGAPGNALGWDLPGPFLTPGQCAALAPQESAGGPPEG